MILWQKKKQRSERELYPSPYFRNDFVDFTLAATLRRFGLEFNLTRNKSASQLDDLVPISDHVTWNFSVWLLFIGFDFTWEHYVSPDEEPTDAGSERITKLLNEFELPDERAP